MLQTARKEKGKDNNREKEKGRTVKAVGNRAREARPEGVPGLTEVAGTVEATTMPTNAQKAKAKAKESQHIILEETRPGKRIGAEGTGADRTGYLH